MKRYTEQEIEWLRQTYPSGGCKAFQQKFDRSNDSIRTKCCELGIKTEEKFRWKKGEEVEKGWFDFKTPEGAYFLGLFWADGTVARGKKSYMLHFGLKIDDFNEVDKYIPKAWKRYERTCKNYPLSWERFLCAYYCSKELVERAAGLGLEEKSLQSPNKILSKIDKSLHAYFFRGWMDGDGYFGGSIVISGAFDTNWSIFESLLKKLRVEYNYRTAVGKNGDKSSRIEINKKSEKKKFVEYLYEKRPDIGLPRKRIAAQSNLEYNQA